MDIHLVKRRGHIHPFDERKVYASCYAACLSTHMDSQNAEKIASKVTNDIKKWVKNRRKTTSDRLFKEIGKVMKGYNKDAAFMYVTHRDIS